MYEVFNSISHFINFYLNLFFSFFDLFCDRVFSDFFAPLVSHDKHHSKPSANMMIVKNTLNFLLQYVVSSETPSFVRRIILSSLRSVVTQVWAVHNNGTC